MPDLAETLDRWIAVCRELGVTKFQRDNLEHDTAQLENARHHLQWDLHPDIHTLYQYRPDLPVPMGPRFGFISDPGVSIEVLDLIGSLWVKRYRTTTEPMSDHLSRISQNHPIQQPFPFSYPGHLLWVGIECHGPARGSVTMLNQATWAGWVAPSLAHLFQGAIKLLEAGYCHTNSGILWIDHKRAKADFRARLDSADSNSADSNSAVVEDLVELAVMGLVDVDAITAENISEHNLAYAWRW